MKRRSVRQGPSFRKSEVSVCSNLKVCSIPHISSEFPALIHEDKPSSDVYVFMTSANMTQLMRIVETAIGGPTCQLSQTKMYSEFVHAQIIKNGTIWDLVVPWLGTKTHYFASNCLKSFTHDRKHNCWD